MRRCDDLSFTAARAIGPYEDALRESVLALKRQPHISRHVQSLLLEAATPEPLNACTRIVPVPLHARRLRSRDSIGVHRGAGNGKGAEPCIGRGQSDPSLGVGKYRAGLDAKGRRDTVTGAFAVRHPRLSQMKIFCG